MAQRDNKDAAWSGLAEIYRHLSKARRRQFHFVMMLMVIGALAELGTIGSVIPFLALLADQSPSGHLQWLTGIFSPLGGGSRTRTMAIAGLVFIMFVLLAGALRLLLTWVLQRFTQSLAHDLTMETQRRILGQPYAFHVDRNSSTVISSIDTVEILVLDVMLPLMQAFTASFTAAVILAGLIYMDPLTTTVGVVAFGAIYVIFSAAAGRRLARNSAVVGEGYDQRVRVVQESVGGIRDAIIDGSQATYLKSLDQVNSSLADARATNAFIASSPRYLIESIGIVSLAVIAAVLALREGGLGPVLPFLGALGLGAQRLLPLLHGIYNGWSTAAGSRSTILKVRELLRLPLDDHDSDAIEALRLRRQIRFDNVSFSYPSRNMPALEGADFEIPTGSVVALVGQTGSGKSTLADILMGLLEPTSGRVMIDGAPLHGQSIKAWWRGIAHVPQAMFLADTSIARNIALSMPDLPPDRERVIEASKKAQLDDFVASLPDGYETIVGERGIRLSGGQRQRLGIARALYKGAPVLVLDEATSALDEATEAAVFKALQEIGPPRPTIIAIAHRISRTLKCDLVIRLDGQGRALVSHIDDQTDAGKLQPNVKSAKNKS